MCIAALKQHLIVQVHENLIMIWLKCYSGNRKNNVLVLSEDTTFRITGGLTWQEKKVCINFIKQTQNFVWACIIILTIFICMLMEKRSLNLIPTRKMLHFQLNFGSDKYIVDLVLVRLDKNLEMKLCMIFQLIPFFW